MFDLISRNLKDNNLSSLSWRIFRHLNISYLWVQCNLFCQSVHVRVCLSVCCCLSLRFTSPLSSQSVDKHIRIGPAMSLTHFWWVFFDAWSRVYCCLQSLDFLEPESYLFFFVFDLGNIPIPIIVIKQSFSHCTERDWDTKSRWKNVHTLYFKGESLDIFPIIFNAVR